MTVKTPPAPPLPTELDTLLRRLRMPYVRKAAPEVIATATAQRWEPAEVLRVLLAEEAAGRDQATIRMRRRQSGLPAGKTFDAWDPDASPIPKATQQALRTLEWIDRAENLCACGPSGTGKSHLATSLGMAACAQGRKVRFFRITELITLLLEAKEERQLLRMRQQLGKLDLLILDELGYVPASKAGAELLFDVIATAYERNSLIVTTNLPFENWTEVLGSERLTGAALDRLTHRCHILETKGESYRLRDAKRRRRRPD